MGQNPKQEVTSTLPPIPENAPGVRLWMENGRLNIAVIAADVNLAQAMITMAQIEIANRVMHQAANPSGLVVATGGLTNGSHS